MTKSEIREQMKRLRNAMPRDERMIHSRAIHQKLVGMEAYRQCTQLFTYLSFGSEVDTWEIIRKILEDNIDNRKIYLPRVEGKSINFYEIKTLDTLKRSKFGVLEPDESHQNPFTIKQQDTQKMLMLMPGLAFDLKGNRIGYGAGYYDRYLAGQAETCFVKIALAYEFQVLDHIDGDPYDIKVDYILTPEGLIDCHN